MLGIALGATVLITVQSVMNGFGDELRDRILRMTSHIEISAYSGNMPNWPAVADTAKQTPRVLAAAPFVMGEGMLRHSRRFSGAVLRGIDPDLEKTVSPVAEHLSAGAFEALQPGEFGIVLGVHLARALGVEAGQKVDVMIPQASVTPAGVIPRFRRFKVVGTFDVDMHDYDRTIAMMHLADLQALYRMGNGVTGVRLKVDDFFAAPSIAYDVDLVLEKIDVFRIRDWTRQHQNLFRAIAMEKTIMFFILLLIIAVAAFNIVSTLVMVVTDKQSDIAILRTLGATPRDIMGIFIVQGMVIGVVGTTLGVVGGLALSLNVEHIVFGLEQLLGRELLSSDIYVISELRGKVNVLDVIYTGLAAFGLTLVSTLYPAWRASRVQPAEALRYE